MQCGLPGIASYLVPYFTQNSYLFWSVLLGREMRKFCTLVCKVWYEEYALFYWDMDDMT